MRVCTERQCMPTSFWSYIHPALYVDRSTVPTTIIGKGAIRILIEQGHSLDHLIGHTLRNLCIDEMFLL